MMIRRVANALARLGQKRRTTAQRVAALVVGAIVFAVVLPCLFLLFGSWLSRGVAFEWPRGLEVAMAVPALVAGLLVAGWATISQWTMGEGTPAPIAAPQRLVVSGAYRHSRNPILLGGILYILGVGTLFESLTTGILGFAVFLTVGSIYFKFIEEKELLLRFGDEYREYRDRTPFLIPRVGRRSRLAA